MQLAEEAVALVEVTPQMRERPNKADKVLAGLRTITGMVAHIAAFGFTIYICIVSQPGSSLFSWHPTLMSMAFSFLMTEAILVFNPESSIFMRASRKTKVRIHWLLQLGAVICAVLGLAAIVANKIQKSKEHFTTWHGVFGLITVIYVLVQAFCGVFLLYPEIPKKWHWKVIQLKVYHATFGLLGFTLACATVVLALFSNFVTSSIEGFAWGLCFFCPAWNALIIMNQVTNTYLPITRKSASL